MPVRVGIELPSRADGDALKRSLEDPTIRAVTLVSGMLLELPSIAQRRAVLALVTQAIASNGHGELPRPRPPEELRLGLGDTGE